MKSLNNDDFFPIFEFNNKYDNSVKRFNHFKDMILSSESLNKTERRGLDNLYHFAYLIVCKANNRFFIGRENGKQAFKSAYKLHKINSLSKEVKDDLNRFGLDSFDYRLISYFDSEEKIVEWNNKVFDMTFQRDFKYDFNLSYNTKFQISVRKADDETMINNVEENSKPLSGFAFSLIGDDLLMKNNNKWEYVSEGFKSIILSHPDFKSIKRYDLVEFVNLIADKK